MTVQYFFDSYTPYWWSMYLALLIGHFFAQKSSQCVWDEDWDSVRYPTVKEALKMMWYNRDTFAAAFIAISIFTGVIFYLA